jgi:hypothetical protein
VRTPAVDRFVQFSDVRKLAAKAANAATSIAHCFLPVSGNAKTPETIEMARLLIWESPGAWIIAIRKRQISGLC